MSKWHNQEIKDLSNDDLTYAAASMDDMTFNRNAQLSKQQERHSRFNLDIVNPKFLEMKNEIETELENRKLKV